MEVCDSLTALSAEYWLSPSPSDTAPSQQAVPAHQPCSAPWDKTAHCCGPALQLTGDSLSISLSKLSKISKVNIYIYLIENSKCYLQNGSLEHKEVDSLVFLLIPSAFQVWLKTSYL